MRAVDLTQSIIFCSERPIAFGANFSQKKAEWTVANALSKQSTKSLQQVALKKVKSHVDST